MKKIMRIALCFLLSLSFIVPVTKVQALVAQGYCGENLQYFLDGDGTLSIEGTGDMYSWSMPAQVPWYEYTDQIKELNIQLGVTSIGNYAFSNLYQLEMAYVPDGVKKIGMRAFWNCSNLNRIFLSSTLEGIGSYAFDGCKEPLTVTFLGCAFDWFNNVYTANNKQFDFGDPMNPSVDTIMYFFQDEVSWTWSSDYSQCKFQLYCPKHDLYESVEFPAYSIDIAKGEPATCMYDGYDVYTAYGMYLGVMYFSGPQYVTTESAFGHDYGPPMYYWSEDRKTLTGEMVCRHDKSHVLKETVNVTAHVTKQPTYEAEGEIVYESDAFSTPGFKKGTLKEMIPRLVKAVPMYRLYNPYSGEHFYTADKNEKDFLVKKGWHDESIGWYAPSYSNVPVFRLYNAYAGDHHYTLNEEERDALIAAGWKYENIGWYSDQNETIPVYREYNPNAFKCNHNYTTDKNEHDTLIKLGWKDEKIAWYGINK